MKKILVFLLTIFIILSISIVGFAHSGGTDSAGGHYNRSTGEYHYHHGYPAHQHPNGVCPYNFVNNENSDNKSSNSSSNIKPSTETTKAPETTKKIESTTKTEVTTKNTENRNKDTIFDTVETAITIIIAIGFISIYLIGYILKLKEHKQEKVALKNRIALKKQKATEFIEENKDEIKELKVKLRQFNDERLLLINKYNNRIYAQRILKITPGVPPDAYFNSDKRIITEDANYPMFVYTSYSGSCFHVKKGHGNGYNRLYLLDAINDYSPCGVCAKKVTQERYQWFFDVYETIHLLEGFGIGINYDTPKYESKSNEENIIKQEPEIKKTISEEIDSYEITDNEPNDIEEVEENQKTSREYVLEHSKRIYELDQTLQLLINRLNKIEFKSEKSALLIAKELVKFYMSDYDLSTLSNELQRNVTNANESSANNWYQPMMDNIFLIGKKVIKETSLCYSDDSRLEALAFEFSFQVFVFYIKELPDEIMSYAKSFDTVEYLCNKYLKMMDNTFFDEEIEEILKDKR